MSSESWSGSHRHASPVSRALSGFRARVMLTVIGSTAWIAFTLLYIGFWAHGFSLFQNIIVILTSIVVLLGAIVAAWVSYGLGMARGWTDW